MKERLIFMLAMLVLLSPQAGASGEEAKKEKGNPVIDVPAGVGRFLYSGFDGVGSLFDALGTGDKAQPGSLQGKPDPLPVTEHERQF